MCKDARLTTTAAAWTMAAASTAVRGGDASVSGGSPRKSSSPRRLLAGNAYRCPWRVSEGPRHLCEHGCYFVATSPHAFCTPSLAEAASLGYSRESCAGWRGGARQPLQPGGDGGVQGDGEEHTQAAKARRVVHRVARDPHRARRAVLTATFRRRCRRLPPTGSQRAGRPPPLLRALRAPRSPTMRPEEMPSRAPAVAVTVVATTFAAAEVEPGSPRRSDPSPARGGCIDDGRARH